MQSVSQILSNHRTAFKMRFWEEAAVLPTSSCLSTLEENIMSLFFDMTSQGGNYSWAISMWISFSFLWEGFVCPFPSSLGWRSATAPLPVFVCHKKWLLVMLLLKTALVGCPSSFQLSFTTVALFNLLLPFCIPSPHLHLGFHSSR